MEINPQSIIVPDAPAQGHTVRVDLEWTPANVPGSIIFYDLACTTPNSSWSDVSSTGSLSFSHTNIGYLGYPIQFRFYPCTLFPYPQEHSIQGTYKIYYDGRLMQTSPLQINGICGSGLDNAIYNASYNPPLITDYTFDIVQENYCFGNEGDIFISGNANSCYNAVEIDTSLNKTLKLEILNGKEFISFYQNGVAKDTATVRYDNINIWNLTIKDITIKQDSFYTGSTPFEVITKSDWAGEVKYDTISINPQTPTQIYVSDEQPRKVYTGFSSIQVKTYSNYSSDSCWTEMPDSVKYRAVIIKGQNLGNLIDYSTGNGGDMLINLDHNNGQIVIGFETEGENLTEQDTVIVSISTTDPNINTVQAMLIVMPGDINVQIIPGTISQGDTAEVILKKRTVNGLVDFDGNKLFNVEITKGSEYGWILDSQTNTQNTTFTNILQSFKIIATDSTGIDSSKIRIKVTTEESTPVARLTRDNTKTNVTERVQTENNDDETILPDWIIPGPIMIEGFGDVVVKVNPFIVEIDPPVISAGDTARIIPKYMNETGIYVEFDSLQTFELGMLDGCMLGKLSNTGIDTNYFYGVTQPFYFIADTSADSGSVNIRVGIIDMNPQNRSLNNNNNTPDSDNPVSCANVSFVENSYANGEVVLESICATLPKCTENNAGKKPDIEVLDLPNGYFGVDLCIDPEIIKKVEDGKSVLGGYHEPCWSKPGEWIIILPQYWLFIRTPDRQIYNDFGIELCYDNNANVVQFGIKGDKLHFKSIVGFCENLIELTNYTMINDTSELRTKVPQNAQSLLLVFNALEVCRTYGNNPGLYYFSEITWAHELQHKENFKTQIVKHCNDNFDYLDYSRFDISCEDAININSVKYDMKQNYKESLEDFEKEVRSLYFNKFGGNNKKLNETNTHNGTLVTNVIDKYQDKVSDLLWELIEN